MFFKEWFTRINSALGSQQAATLAKLGEFIGKLAVFAGVVAWLWEIPDRADQRHQAAWTLINSAHGQSGNGGRTSAIEGLSRDGISLAGIDLTNAELPGVKFRQATLDYANFLRTNLRGARFECDWLGWLYLEIGFSPIVCTQISYARFLEADLTDADFSHVIAIAPSFLGTRTFYGTNFEGAFIANTSFDGAMLRTNFRNSILSNVKFSDTHFAESEVIFDNALLFEVDLSSTDADEKMFSRVHASLCKVTLPKRAEVIRSGCNTLYDLEKRQSILVDLESNYWKRKPYTINYPASHSSESLKE